jgi:2-isopropylmalate synthase
MKRNIHRIRICDLTLREGLQSGTIALNPASRVRAARCISQLRPDSMEVGFPAAGQREAESVAAISALQLPTDIAALARCLERDVELCLKCLEPARERAWAHVFIGVSRIHRKNKLRMSSREILQSLEKMIQLVHSAGCRIQAGLEDASRAEFSFLSEIVALCSENGAESVCIADTLGLATPLEFGRLFRRLKRRFPEQQLSAHCHNDLGLALANSLAAAQNGASTIESSMFGIGERAGSAATEEVIAAMRIRAMTLGIDCLADVSSVCRIARELADICNLKIPERKPIIGERAFTTFAGVHQDGILKCRATYEGFSPECIGASPASIRLSSASGRAAVRHKACEAGYNHLDSDQLEALYQAFMALADETTEVDVARFNNLCIELLGNQSDDRDSNNSRTSPALHVSSLPTGPSKSAPSSCGT